MMIRIKSTPQSSVDRGGILHVPFYASDIFGKQTHLKSLKTWKEGIELL